jgi:plastocyanin
VSVRYLGPAVVAVLVLLSLTGCGVRDEPDLVNGKTLFVGQGACGSCHALARAGTQGIQGPDLDEAFGPSREDGLGTKTIAGIVRDQIAHPRRSSAMPADLVTGDDARDVAAYVAAVAGASGRDTGALAQAGQPKRSDKPVVASNGRLEIAADPTGALAFVTSRATAPPGELELVMPNQAPIPHNIAVRNGGTDAKGPVVGQGGTSRVSEELAAGKYTFYCSVPGHEEGGMKGELTVE